MTPYVDVMPLQDEEPNANALLWITDQKPLQISRADWDRFAEMCGQDFVGRKVVFSVAPDGVHIRIRLELE